jgi:hypothetical protein
MRPTDVLYRAAARARATLKHRLLGPLLYRHPPVGLQPERLYTWHDTLRRTVDVPGAILEIGCNVGGTAAVSWRFLQHLGVPRQYLAIDTFDGFVPDQFDQDVALGNDPANRFVFADNSLALTRSVLDRHGAHGVELLRADIVELDAHALPQTLAAVLIDVDLAGPVRVALDKVWPRLAVGGMIVVDDCPEACDWQARQGYLDFVRSRDLPERFMFDMGIVEQGATLGTSARTAG